MDETLREFYHVEDILVYAYKCEAGKSPPSAMFSDNIRGTNPSDLSELERIADGLMIKNTAMRGLNTDHRHIVAARYRLPFDDALYNMHEYNIRTVAKLIQAEKTHIRNLFFIQDVIRDWSENGQPHHKDLIVWWSKHMNIPQSTVQRWVNVHGHSIKDALDDHLALAQSKLVSVLDHLLV